MTLNLVKDRLWKGGACTKPVPLGQATGTSTTCPSGKSRLGQVVLFPVGQADWDRLYCSQWDRQTAYTKPVPLGLGKVKKKTSPCHMGQVIYPRWRPFLVPGQALYPRWSLSQFHLSQLVRQRRSTSALRFPHNQRVCATTMWDTGWLQLYMYHTLTNFFVCGMYT